MATVGPVGSLRYPPGRRAARKEAALTRSQAQRHAFLTPINLDAAAAAFTRAHEVQCTCERSPFCRGQASANWLICAASCRACQPSPWQAPTRIPAAASDPNT